MPRHIEFRHVAMLSLALEPRPCAIHRRRARRQDRACRQHLPNVRPNRFSRLCTRRIPGRRYPVRSRLRHGQSGAQRTAVPTYGARCGIDLEAVHGDVDADPREGGQAVPRRSCSEALPRDAAYADGITWRRALSQTSGLRDLWVTWAQTGRSFAGDTVDALNVIFHSAEPNYTPGERYLYTNTDGYWPRRRSIASPGRRWRSLPRRGSSDRSACVIRDSSRIVMRSSLISPRAATARSGFRIVRSNYDGAIQGPGGIHTTVEDFGRWLNNYEVAAVGGRDIIQVMTTPTKLNNGLPATSGPGMAYAIGLTVGTQRGLRVVAHGGSWVDSAATSSGSPTSDSQ